MTSVPQQSIPVVAGPAGRISADLPSARALERRRMLFWLVPPLAWFSVFMLVPYGTLFYYSVGSVDYVTFVPGFSLDNFVKIFSDPPYGTVLLRSLKMGFFTALFSTIVAYPLALFMAFQVRSGLWRYVLYVIVILPWWASYLVKAYAWKTILGTTGILNEFLMGTGITSEPITVFIYNQTAMVLTLTYIFTPFAVLSIYAQLERIPPSLINAAKDAGANDWEIFRLLILPISVPGILAGAVITFSLGFGDFIAAVLVGGADGLMIANVIINLMGTANNWPLGSAIGIVTIFFSLALLTTANYLEHKSSVRI